MPHQRIDINNHINEKTNIASWQVENPKAIVHILHGMGEHKARYDHFASFLNQHDIHVYAHDHLGHGEAISEDSPLGHFHNDDGFNKVVGIVEDVQNYIHLQHPGVPVFLLGHSMGSFIAQHYLVDYPCRIKGLILSGSAYTPTPLLRALKFVAGIEALRLGKKGNSSVINLLSFGSYNNNFKPRRTEFDWLSRNESSVDDYIADELCGFICSCSGWQQLASGLLVISKPENLEKIPSTLPVSIISGDMDPVGNSGKYVKALEQHWKNTGHHDVTLNLIENARHEVLNETDRELHYNALLQWLEKQLKSPA